MAWRQVSPPFVPTWNACFIRQYMQIVQAHLSATTPVGDVQLEPFIAYYVDTPVPKNCPLLNNRWADQRKKFLPIYPITVTIKERLQRFFYDNVVQFRMVYSPPLLREFFKQLPSRDYTEFARHERYVNSHDVVSMLKRLTLADLVRMAANKRSYYYGKWLKLAEQDKAPVIEAGIVDRIDNYCRTATLFVVLPDDHKGFQWLAGK